MYPYEIQHRKGEPLKTRGDGNISLSILFLNHGIYICQAFFALCV